MKKYIYSLKSLSSLILSPRGGAAFYKDLGQFDETEVQMDTQFLKDDQPKIIYPFYRYGLYERYAPEEAQFYIPGSSVKGSLFHLDSLEKKEKQQGMFTGNNTVMVDDIIVPNGTVVLRNLYKLQYLDDPEKTVFETFFENVAVEMVKADTNLEGTIYLPEEKLLINQIEKNNEKTKKKIQQMLRFVKDLQNEEKLKNEEVQLVLLRICENLSELQDETNLILLGGYKGLLHSILLPDKKDSHENVQNGLYIDKETYLPHGILRIRKLN